MYIWGADHHGYITRLRAGLTALGGPPECFEVRLVQFVSLFRGGEKAQMSTRSGEFVTLRDLRNEVGNDAARLFYVMRSNDQHLDFDLELAKARSNDNPVDYIQYAHARVASVLRQLKERAITYDTTRGGASLATLQEPQELLLIKRLVAFPEIVAPFQDSGDAEGRSGVAGSSFQQSAGVGVAKLQTENKREKIDMEPVGTGPFVFPL